MRLVCVGKSASHKNSGKSSEKLFNAQLQSISNFTNYPSYKKRKKEILLNRLYAMSKTNKKSAIKEFFYNIDQIYKILYLKSIYNFLIK